LRPWAPALMIVAASALAVGLALWQRREEWALVAGLALNLAMSLVLWDHGARDVSLLQANVIAAAVVALGWLAVAPRLYGISRPGPGTAPLLGVQMTLLLFGGAALVLRP